jgi:two-component system OmpR family sensor kinase
MARLTEDLLLLARIDERSALNIEPVDLSGLAAESVETARTVGPEWPVDFVAEGSVEVMGDWNSLRQVMDNLLANVRAHTPQGTPATVRVGVTQKDAYIEVADRGPGFTDEEASKVFERFFRADPSRSRETGGAGLGLAIVATIVHSLGGRVIAAPRPGGGAIFTIVLPALDSDYSPEE